MSIHEALEFMFSLKMHNGEGGQDDEDGMVSTSFKGVFLLETLILDHYSPNNMGKSISMSFEACKRFPFTS